MRRQSITGHSFTARDGNGVSLGHGTPSGRLHRPGGSGTSIVTHYIIRSDGAEQFRGPERTFTDTVGIRPYQEYSYIVEACTVDGSTKVVAETVQGIPENVHPPRVTALSPESLKLTWKAPAKPDGIIRSYQISQMTRAVIPVDGDGRMKHIETDMAASGI
ncbi:USH2A protein, partial [Polypterus senegalus]